MAGRPRATRLRARGATQGLTLELNGHQRQAQSNPERATATCRWCSDSSDELATLVASEGIWEHSGSFGRPWRRCC